MKWIVSFACTTKKNEDCANYLTTKASNVYCFDFSCALMRFLSQWSLALLSTVFCFLRLLVLRCPRLGVEVEDVNGRVEVFDKCIVGSHAPDALQMLGEGATYEERTILGAFQYSARYGSLKAH